MQVKSFVIGLIVACGLTIYPAYGAEYYIHAGAVVDPTDLSARSEVTVIVSGKVVSDIRAGYITPEAETTQIIDLRGHWLLPGLVDTHTHLGLSTIPEKNEHVSNAYRALMALDNARAVLNAGFTTVRDVGSEGDYVLSDLRRAVAEGRFVAPTIINAGKPIAPFGGQSGRPHPIPHEYGAMWEKDYLSADGLDAVLKAVRENLYYGAQVIKVVADQKNYHYSLQEMQAIVKEAHAAGVKVGVHTDGGVAANYVIESGADSIEHGFNLSEDQLRLMKKNGVVLSTTDFPLSHLDVIFQGNTEQARKWHAVIVKRLRAADDLGVTLTFGTDVLYPLGGKDRGRLMLDFLDTWKDAKIADTKVLQAMTTNAYALLGIAKERGRILPGFFADMIAVPGDPRADILLLRNTNFVMKEGVVVRHD